MAAPVEISDEMIRTAMKLWFEDDYEDGRLLGCSASLQEEAEAAFRDILEAVAPLLIAQGMERAADMAETIMTNRAYRGEYRLDQPAEVASAIRSAAKEV